MFLSGDYAGIFRHNNVSLQFSLPDPLELDRLAKPCQDPTLERHLVRIVLIQVY